MGCRHEPHPVGEPHEGGYLPRVGPRRRHRGARLGVPCDDAHVIARGEHAPHGGRVGDGLHLVRVAPEPADNARGDVPVSKDNDRA